MWKDKHISLLAPPGDDGGLFYVEVIPKSKAYTTDGDEIFNLLNEALCKLLRMML